jgi:type VI secretion system protein VasG
MRVDIKGLIAKLNPYCTQALQAAAGLCLARGHYEVTCEHLAHELVGEGHGDWSAILAAQGQDPALLVRALDGFLETCPRGHSGRPVFAPPLLDLLQDAWLVASVDLGEPGIRSSAILAALLSRLPLQPAGGPFEGLRCLSRETLLKEPGTQTEDSREATVKGLDRADPSPDQGSFLGRFCQDFTRNAREGGIDPVFGRDPEIRQIIDILARRRKNNPILVGDPGVGKTAVVEGLALRMVQGEVPAFLQDVTLLALDLGLLEAGAGLKGEFETRLKGVLREIKAFPRPVILFVDEAHTLVGAGGGAGGSDAANLLKPALARGEARTIAATTWTEYKKYFEKDPALARRFQLVKLKAPSVAETVQILRGIRPHYERAHKVFIRDDALVAAAEVSDRYLAGRHLPDKAIDLLDTSCARVKVNLSAAPAALEDREREIQALERELAALERDRDQGVPASAERIRELPTTLEGLRASAEVLTERWVLERHAVAEVLELRDREPPGTGLALLRDQARRRLETVQAGNGLVRFEVDPDGVAQVVSDWTGVPLGRLLRDEAAGILELEARLGNRIQGQDQALLALGDRLRAAKAGIRAPGQPLGVFLAVGPSGVGKTETALALAELLFGSEKSLVTVNMSEFQEAHSVSRLVGSPPGYVGYGEGGMLTEAVRQRPYAVVLLDEVEKAHRDVLNLFYQVFDKGTLADGEGKEIDFKNTVLMLTSNLAAEAIQELTLAEGASALAVAEAIRPILARHFKPALLARMTVVPFFALGGEAMARIVRLKLERLRETLWANNRIRLEHDPAVVDWLLARCADPDTGARAIDRVLQGEVLPGLSREILARLGQNRGLEVRLDVDPAGGIGFAFRAGEAREA